MKKYALFLGLTTLSSVMISDVAFSKPLIMENGSLKAVTDNDYCTSPVRVTVTSDKISDFQNDKKALQLLIGGMQVPLQMNCKTLPYLEVSGKVSGTEVYQGNISAKNGWKLVDIKQPQPQSKAYTKSTVTKTAPVKKDEINTASLSSVTPAAPKAQPSKLPPLSPPLVPVNLPTVSDAPQPPPLPSKADMQNAAKDSAKIQPAAGKKMFANEIAFFNAVGKGDTNTVKQMLAESKGYFKARNEKDRAALHHALINGQQLMALTLIEEGADINEKDGLGYTPLHYATYNGHALVAKALLKKGVDVKSYDKTQGTPLHNAVMGDQPQMFAMLVEAGADIHALDSGKRTPMHFAVANNSVASTKELIRLGANPNFKAIGGPSIITMAAMKDATEVVKVLVQHGVDVKNFRSDGAQLTLIHFAASADAAEMVKLLISLGVDPRAKATDGKTAYDVAKSQAKAILAQYQ